MLAEQQLCADLSYRGGELVTALARREIAVKALDVPFDASPFAEVGRTGGIAGDRAASSSDTLPRVSARFFSRRFS